MEPASSVASSDKSGSRSLESMNAQTTEDHPSTKGQFFCQSEDDEATTSSTATMPHSNVSARGAIHRISKDYFAGDTVLLRSLETNPAGLAGALRSFGSNIDSVAEATDDVIISSIRSYVQPQNQQPMEHIDEGSAMTTDGSGDIDCPDRMSESEPSGPNDIMSTDYTMMDVSEGNGGTGGRKNSG
jgi:hypothetical protein